MYKLQIILYIAIKLQSNFIQETILNNIKTIYKPIDRDQDLISIKYQITNI